MTIATLTLNPAIDESSSVDHVVSERKLRCGEPSYEPGGGGINVSRAVRELEGDSRAVFTSGGAPGDLLLQLLHDAGLQAEPIAIEGMTRQNLTVFDESTTEQYRFVMPGPALTDADAAACLRTIRGLDPVPEYLVLSGSLPRGVAAGFYAQVAEHAPDTTRVVVDTSGEALQRTVEAGVFLIKPNLRELGQLVGQELHGDPEIEAAARELIEKGEVQHVVVSLGAGGALHVSREHSEHVRSPTVPIRSKVGAGDSMVAGLVTRLAAGDGVAQAVRFGVAAGAAAVMTEGTRLCRREDVERLYEEMS